jgi:hypothetical protein
MVTPKQKEEDQEGERLTTELIKELLSQETNQAPDKSNETKYRPVVSPQTERLLAGVGFKREVCLPKWNEHHDGVVYETGQ